MNSDTSLDRPQVRSNPRPNTVKAKPPRGARRRAAVTVVAAVGLLGTLVAAGTLPRMHRARAMQAEEEALQASVPSVSVVTPIHATGANDLTLPGNIEPVEQTAVNARTTGYVRKWYVDIGARVKAGQLLAEIESPEVDQQVAQARADEAKARADVAKARANLEQAKANLGTQRAAVEQAKADSARLEAAISQASADSARAQANYQAAKADAQRAKAGVTQGRAEVSKSGANLGQARATVARQQAAVAQARQALAEKKANLTRARSDLEIARKTSERWRKLVEDGAVSKQEADEKDAVTEARQSDLAAAEAAVQSAQSNVEAAQAAVDASKADVEAAQAGIGSSEANVEAAQAGESSNLATADAVQASVRSSEANVEAARAAWRSSQASIRAAEQKVEAAASDVRSAEAAVNAATSTVNSATANVRRYTVLQGFQRLTAPFDGVITSRNVDNGMLVSAGAPAVSGGDNGSSRNAAAMRGGLYGIARSDVLRIQVNVPQTFVTQIREGQKAVVAVREFPHREFVGEIARLSGALDPSSRTLQAEVRLSNPGGALVPGMYAEVKLAPAGAVRTLRVPATTLIVGADGTQVAVVRPDRTIHLQKIRLGDDLGAELEVLEGLQGGEELVENPSTDLAEGTKVEAAPAAPVEEQKK